MPNQSGISTFFIATCSKAAGPQAIELPVTSTGQQPSGTSAFEGGLTSLPTVPVMQSLGEVHPGAAGANTTPTIYAEIEEAVPTAGVPPTPQPTVKNSQAWASTGAQPSVTTPFTGSDYETDTTHPVPAASGVTPGQNV
jgi:hypothetical protein